MNNKKIHNEFKHILDTYTKKTKEEEDKKQFQYTLSKNIFFSAVVILVFKLVYFSIYDPSILEVYLSFVHIFLFVVSFFLFVGIFIEKC